jgi:antitoxin component of MazEF toxin-antitoxin module
LPTIQTHYDGWLHLPTEACQQLGIVTGGRLAIEFINGALVLRPVQQGKEAEAAVAPAEAADATAEPTDEDARLVTPKRGPGRPRKAVPQELAPRIKVGGRRKSTLPA